MIIRTKYTVVDTFLPSIKKQIEVLKDNKIPFVILADQFNMISHYEFYKIKSSVNPELKVFYGIELSLSIENFLTSIVLFAKNNKGLFKLRTLKTYEKETKVKGTPNIVFIDKEVFETLLNDNDIVIFCGLLNNIVKYKANNLHSNFNQFQKVFLKKPEGFYTPVVNYLFENDRKMLMLFDGNRKQSQLSHFDTDYLNTTEYKTLLNFLMQLDYEEITFEPNSLPTIPLDLKIINNKLKKLGLENNLIYKERLKKEYSIIKQKGFLSYFAIVYDLVKEMRKVMMVGPGRGSAAGSLFCYLLDITIVDPIKFDLIFERFIDVSREDLPDIDIDFEFPHIATKYLSEKYGYENVAHISTTLTYQWKTALNEFLRVGELNSVERKILNSISEEDKFENIVEKTKNIENIDCLLNLINYPKTFGTHASGIVITKEPLKQTTRITQKEDGSFIADISKYLAEEQGLVKIDVLGLSTLTQIKNILNFLDKDEDFLPKEFNDKKVYENIFHNNLMAGIFQFSGSMLRRAVYQTKPNNFEDISALTAVGRPGALIGGMFNQYVKNRDKKNIEPYNNKILNDIVSESSGAIIYQEQSMKIANLIGGLDLIKTNQLRKLIGKKVDFSTSDIAKELKEEFFKNAIKKIGEAETKSLWNTIEAMGAYQFNKSHSVCYSVLSYYLAWLKTYHELAFYIGSLNNSIDKENQLFSLIGEMLNKKYTFSKEVVFSKKFNVVNEEIKIPLVLFKGIGDKKADQIIKKQKFSLAESKIIANDNNNIVQTIINFENQYKQLEKQSPYITRPNEFEFLSFQNKNSKNKIYGFFDTIIETSEQEEFNIFVLKDTFINSKLKVNKDIKKLSNNTIVLLTINNSKEILEIKTF